MQNNIQSMHFCWRIVIIVNVFAEHWVQTESVAPRRCWSRSNGRRCPLSFSQSHLSSVCCQHPCTITCSGKGKQIPKRGLFIGYHTCHRVLASRKNYIITHFVIVNELFLSNSLFGLCSSVQSHIYTVSLLACLHSVVVLFVCSVFNC